MQSNFYVGLSAQISLQRRLETIANNVANASTAGFRAEEVKFEHLLSRVSARPGRLCDLAGRRYLSRKSGELVRTDNMLDVAVQGDAWLAVQTPAGTAYTRDGRMQMTDTGELRLGQRPADARRRRRAAAARPQRRPADDRTRRHHHASRGARSARSASSTSTSGPNLTRVENSGVVPDRPADPALDFGKVGVHQGFIERSNVNPVLEMTQLDHGAACLRGGDLRPQGLRYLPAGRHQDARRHQLMSVALSTG